MTIDHKELAHIIRLRAATKSGEEAAALNKYADELDPPQPPAPKIENCPWCGAEAFLSSSNNYAECRDSRCLAEGPASDPTGAKWNEIARLVRIGREAEKHATSPAVVVARSIGEQMDKLVDGVKPEPHPAPTQPSLADLEAALRRMAVSAEVSWGKPCSNILLAAADLVRTLRVEGAEWRARRQAHVVGSDYSGLVNRACFLFDRLGVPESAT